MRHGQLRRFRLSRLIAVTTVFTLSVVATLAWARSLGEFGPILVFAGATRMRTEVMPTTVFLELSVGNLEPALAVSLLMVIVSVGVLLIVRWAGDSRGGTHDRL